MATCLELIVNGKVDAYGPPNPCNIMKQKTIKGMVVVNTESNSIK